MITLDLSCQFQAAGLPVEGDWPESSHVPAVAAMFGLAADDDHRVTVLPRTRLTLRPHQVVFVTGPSGSGKSTLLRLVEEQLQRRRAARAVRVDAAPLPDAAMVDCFDGAPLDEALRALSLAGLGDAFVMLRRPRQASDGQRYRLRLALALRQATRGGGGLPVLLADEFGATLDRVTARVLARNLRAWVSRTPVCFIAATTHDDLLEPLEPDVLIEKGLGAAVEVATRPGANARRLECTKARKKPKGESR